ncbi:solute carrier family 15 member 2 [Trichonephila clavata]|uniref:Oligopeptide transporter 1 n=1 Tax=Trichonephila clavata TaxID=2740835 RepID=A0A8X6LJE4_TRICU|nr:solute carrier family 15 member 2 [Trichonephila clavata]
MPDTSEKEEQETESRDETDEVDEEPTKTDDEEKNKGTSKKQKEKSKKKKDKSKKGKETSEKGQDKSKIPKGALFIFAYEFCERFNFYGLSAIQTMFLFRELDFDESTSVKIYHGVEVIAYLMPILGAILADTWLGKFRAIVYLSIVYACGNIVLAIGSIPNQLIIMRAVSLVGLFTLSVGTGGIKPCVSSFGGDQFSDEQEEMRHQFFSAFYFAINSGSLISTALTPVLREDVTCFGGTSCFPLAYLVTNSIYIIGFILFIIGKTFYVRKPAEGSVLVSFCSCIGHAVYRRATVKKDEKRENCLDYADDKYDKSLIKDIKCVLSILYMYIPLPLFWALWEQQGSRWVLQGSKMDGEIQGHFIQPDQMILLNPFLILILIPILNWVIYPLLGRLNLLHTPLQRMTLGGLLVACSYIIAAFISFKIESDAPAIPPEGKSEMVIVNNSPCTLKMESPEKHTLEEYSTASLNVPLKKVSKWRFAPTGCNTTITAEKDFKSSETFNTMMVALDGEDLVIQVTNDSRQKLKSGNPRIRLLFSIDYKFTEDEEAFFMVRGRNNIQIFPDKMTRSQKVGMTEYYSMKPGEYELFLPVSETDHEEDPIEKMKLKQGGSTIVFFYRKKSKHISVVKTMETVKANSLHILWQIPQYVVLTTGEAMFSITGLDFSYSQAPTSLKAVIQAIWQSTTAIGNLLVVLLSEIRFKKQSHELIMFSLLMTLSMGAFAILAYFYKYVETKKESKS